MPCELDFTAGNPLCRFKGTTGAEVTLRIVGIKGRALFFRATYDGKELVATPSDELTFTIKSGHNDLSVAYTFSRPDGTAELHEKCPGDTLLDDEISGLGNIKLYGICGSDGAADGAVATKKAARKASKKAVKKATRARRPGSTRRGR